jgi:hypothetical protein
VEFSKLLANLIDGYVTYIKSYDGYNTVVNFGKLNKIHLTESGIEIIKDKIKFINK